MDHPTEQPALKPQWLRSQNGGANGNAATANPNSNGNCNSNRLTSLPSDGLRTRDKDKLGKSKAYSSFGTRSNRNRNRSRKQEKDIDFFDRDSSLVFDHFDTLLDIRSDKDKLRRSRSLISAPVTDIWPENKTTDNKDAKSFMDGVSSKNGFLSSKEFPSLKTNGHVETGRRVSSPIERISVESVAKNGGEGWNSVLAEVPLTAGTIGSGANSPRASGLAKETVNGLNMAQAVAQAPAQDRTTPQLAIDPHKIDELTIRQCKQLIPVTPSANKNLVARSSDRLKVKGLAPSAVSKAGSQPLNPSPRASLKPETVNKPMSQIGTFQILNREKNGTITSAPAPAPAPTMKPINTTTKVSATVSKNKCAISKQAKARHEFFNILRTKASSNGTETLAETGFDSSPTAVDNASDKVKSENHVVKSENWVPSDKDHCGGIKWEPSIDEEIPLDPKEEALLRLLGWDPNAKIEYLTQEEIDAFWLEYEEKKAKLEEKKMFPMVSFCFCR